MKNHQISNMAVYAVLFAVIFAISFWLLAFHGDNPTNWMLYAVMAAAIIAAFIKLAVDSRRKRQASA